MTRSEILNWLLRGDISIQYKTYRDLLDTERPDLKERISKEGWGKKFLNLQNPEGRLGRSYYQPKWISTHYTLLDLKYLEISREIESIHNILDSVLDYNKSPDGGIHPIGLNKISDVCLNGMFLNFASYFEVNENKLESVIDFILSQKMPDGGFNCHSNRKGAVHSSLHSTTSVTKGIHEYLKAGYEYRASELMEAEIDCREFILLHRLFLSDRTGKIIHKEFLKLSYPWRWKFNILKGLNYFCDAEAGYGDRMAPAIEMILKKRRKDNRWPPAISSPGTYPF